MDIQDVEKLIGARYSDSYASGHMGSQIWRFQRQNDHKPLVVKFAAAEDADAMTDIAANVLGYEKIRSIGGSSLIPSGLKEIPATDGRALVMEDLGQSMRVADRGLSMFVMFWIHFRQVVLQTVSPTQPKSSGLPSFVAEVVHHMERFSHGDVPRIIETIGERDWGINWGRPALMLLDFTPDNLFVREDNLAFIDPWPQNTYLGHPAVSIGQFIALTRIYQMRDAGQATCMLEGRCREELPAILGCDVSSIEQALRIGMTLQYVLSSYVRQTSAPSRANEILAEAFKLW
ncbi:hypothetical protein JXA59_02525 [Patescibacteria group bacterium]|nr:hypothetical protein [Patescibacteria group bacterium]